MVGGYGATRKTGAHMKATVELCERQLDRTMAFFPRVDAKATALFAIDSGLLAVMGTHIRADQIGLWYAFLPAVLATAAIAIALSYIYVCSFPQLKGGAGSLIFFGEIAKRTEAQFAKEFQAASQDERLQDFLCQIWRNSEILKIKFHAVKLAFIWTAISLVPWTWFLAVSSWMRSV